jgi:hypothetical protein
MDRLWCANEFEHFIEGRKYVSGLLDRLGCRGLDGNARATDLFSGQVGSDHLG